MTREVVVQKLLADLTVSISELKKSIGTLVEDPEAVPMAVLNHNRVMAYLVPAAWYEDLIEEREELRRKVALMEEATNEGSETEVCSQSLSEAPE
jgi:antitoxin StbD